MQISLRAYNQIIEDLLENDQIDEVIAHCRHILQEYPRHLDTLRTLGKASLDHGSLEHSASAFSQVLSSLPSDFVSNLGISFILQTQGDISGSIWYLERVFESNPNNLMVQDELKKLITTRDGKTPERLNKTNAILAQIYANSGEYLRAIEEITAIIADDPKRADMKTLLVKIYYEMNDTRRALEACEDCFTDSPYNFDVLKTALKLSEKTGTNDSAEDWRLRLLELDPYAIDPATKLLVGEKPLPDELVMIDKLDWSPTDIEPSDVEVTAPREGLGAAEEPSGDESAETQATQAVEPIEEIPVEQETPQWLKDLLSDTKSGSAPQKFDREAGESMPDWVRDLEPDTAPKSTEDKGLLPSEIEKLQPSATRGKNDFPAMPVIDPNDDTNAEAFTPKLSDDWKPIPVEREDPMEALAATRKSARTWYAEREAIIAEPQADPLEKVSHTQPTTPVASSVEPQNLDEATEPSEEPTTPTDWRDDLDLDWIGVPREEDAAEETALAGMEPARTLITENDEKPPVMVELPIDPSELDWLGDLGKPADAQDADWLGDIGHPMEATMKSPVVHMQEIGHAAGSLPDMPNVLLPEGSMLPKEPIESIPQSAIEETADPATTMGVLAGEIISTENTADEVDSGDDSAGEDFYASLQNPPSESQLAQKNIDEEQSLIRSVGGEYDEPIEEVIAEASSEVDTCEIGSPDEPAREIEVESSDEPIQSILPEIQNQQGGEPAMMAEELEVGEPFEPFEEILAEKVETESVPESEPDIQPELDAEEAFEPVAEIVAEEVETESAVEVESEPVGEPEDESPSEPVAEIVAEAVEAESTVEFESEPVGEPEDEAPSELVEEIVAEDDKSEADVDNQPELESREPSEPVAEIQPEDEPENTESLGGTDEEPIGIAPTYTEGGQPEQEVEPFEMEDDLQYDEPEADEADEASEDAGSEQPDEFEADDDSSVETDASEIEPSDEAREEQFIGSAFDRGKRYLESGQLDKALTEFSDLIKYERMLDQILPIMREIVGQNPENKRALRVLGDAYFNADKLDEALAAYAKADDMPDEEI